jgi:hypothetical protein
MGKGRVQGMEGGEMGTDFYPRIDINGAWATPCLS